MKLLDWTKKYLLIFNWKRTEALLPLHKARIDHSIELERDIKRKEKEVLQGLLYNILRDKLLVLQKTLIDLLNKGFIYISSLLAIALILFVCKLSRGLRFYIDYQGLNHITKKDYYLLPLIYKILQNISKVRQFIKLDIIIMFHKIRIIDRDKQKTAFQTYYRLFK